MVYFQFWEKSQVARENKKKNARVTAKVPLKNQKNTIVTSTKKLHERKKHCGEVGRGGNL